MNRHTYHLMTSQVSPLRNTDIPMQSVSFFKALADPIRLRIVHLLTLQQELCVCHFIEIFDLPQSSISRHLSTLRNAGLVIGRRDKLWVHYRLGIQPSSPYFGIINELSAFHQIEPILAEDMQRVKNISCST